MADAQAQPWYHEPWPWLVMSGPAIVVVAGVATAIIAFRTSDGLVSDDYYKQGLVINQELQRDEKARTLGISADISFSPGRDRVRLVLAGQPPGAESLRLTLLHPTLAGRDQNLALTMLSPGLYEAAMLPALEGTWRLQLEDRGGGWRLVGAWRGKQDRVSLGQIREQAPPVATGGGK